MAVMEAPPTQAREAAQVNGNGNGTPNEWPFHVAVVRFDEMLVDDEYQRPLTSFVNRIKTRFDPALVGTLVVSTRKRGKRRYAIIDGQTRWNAMIDLELTEWPCVVFEGLTPAQEADLFERLQRERRGVLSYHRFRAALKAGRPEAQAINAIVESIGYEVGPSGGGGVIPAVAGLEAVYRRSPELLEQSLSIFKEAWRDRWMFEGSHLRAMGYFLQHMAPEIKQFDDEKFARRLSIVSPEELKRRASQLREGRGVGGGSDKYMAEALDGVYRRGKEG